MSQDALALFLQACGLTDALRLSVGQPGKQQPTRRVFPQPFVLIGRAAQADLSLADASVSQRHAYLQVIAGRAFCFDLPSRTGVRWDGKQTSFGWVERDQFVDIGPCKLE